MANYQENNNFLKHLGNYNYALMQLNKKPRKEQSEFLPLTVLGASIIAFLFCQIVVSIVLLIISLYLFNYNNSQNKIEKATIDTYFNDFLEQTKLENVSMYDSREVALNYIMEKYSHIDKYNLELCKKHISNLFPFTGERVDSLKEKKNIENLFIRIADVEHTILHNLDNFNN